MDTDTKEADAILKRIQQKRDSYMRRDAEGALEVWLNSEDVCVFDLGAIPQYFGYQALRKTMTEMVAGSTGPFEIDFGNPTVLTSGDLGTSWQILRVVAQQKSGTRTDILVRQTDVWRKVDGKWYIVHEHVSLPMKAGESEKLLSISDETMSTHPGAA